MAKKTSKKEKTPKVAERMVAQGDVMFIRVDSLPKSGLTPIPPENGRLVVAHSETGHHHTVDATGAKLYQGEDPNVCYLQLAEGVAFGDVVHHRAWDTHDTIRLLGKGGDVGGEAVWKIQRQSEWSPEGWRRVED